MSRDHVIVLDLFDYPYCRLVVMSDGSVVLDHGKGVIIRSRPPDLDDPMSAMLYAIQKVHNLRAAYDKRPAVFHDYVGALKEVVTFDLRAELHLLVTRKPYDPHAVWIEFGRSHPELLMDRDASVKLCRLYQLAESLHVAGEGSIPYSSKGDTISFEGEACARPYRNSTRKLATGHLLSA